LRGQNAARTSVCLSSELHPAKYNDNHSLPHADAMIKLCYNLLNHKVTPINSELVPEHL